MRAESLCVGTAVNDYVIAAKLGAGAFGAVFKVTKGGNTFAMKVIEKTELQNPGDKRRLQRELDTMAYIKHPNTVSLLDFFTDRYNFYLILEFCQGGDLASHLAKESPLREKNIAAVFKQIVTAVAYLHAQGIAHRDLKPENILITTFPNVKVSDFGLCGFTSNGKMETFCGSPCYTAPECLSRIQYEGPPADVWSLGVILYELVTGRHPWDIANVPKMVKDICSGKYTIPMSVSQSCQDLIRSMLKVKPADRITCERILQHPWLKMAGSRGQSTKLPPLKGPGIVTFTESPERSAARTDSGIVSPFLGRDNQQLRLSATPRSGTEIFTAARLQRANRRSLNGPHSPTPVCIRKATSFDGKQMTSP